MINGPTAMNGTISKPTKLSKKCTLAFPPGVPWILGDWCAGMFTKRELKRRAV